MSPTKRPLEEGFETAYATALVGVDTLMGGDVGCPDGGAHFIADTFPKEEVELPPIYEDARSVKLREDGGMGAQHKAMVASYINDYGLEGLQESLPAALPENASEARRRFMENLGRCLDVIARTGIALAEVSALPPFEERYEAAARRAPKLVDTTELKERMRAVLDSAGVKIRQSETLREAIARWETQNGFIPAAEFGVLVDKANRDLTALTRSKLFAGINFDLSDFDPHLLDVSFDGCVFKTVSNVNYTGSSTFEGGVHPDGTPASKSLVECNTDHSVTNIGLQYLVAHEIAPGHYMDSAVADLGWRTGRLGLEAVAHTMCTAETVMREGWAQNTLLALHGSERRLAGVFGPDQAVQALIERLQDAGKNNASILYQMQRVPIEEVRQHLREECLLPEPIVQKLSGVWAQHPILGPMYGPAYHVGAEVVRQAIEAHGPLAVAKVAFHTKGYTDIETFQMAMAGRAS
ncbi:MAG: hypothetical protein WC924_03815 [Candidatus Gracilibacteria bacterium]